MDTLTTDPLLAEIDRVIAERIAAQGSAEDEEALRLEESFIDFVEAAWPSIDPAEFQRSWVVEAMAEHLQAVADGQIKRLVTTVPPRCSKTLLASESSSNGKALCFGRSARHPIALGHQ
jgi:hypothetical protein